MKKFIAAAVLAALIASPAYAALSVGAKAPDFATQGSLGGKAFEWTGAYDWVWYADILLAVAAALLHLPIREARLKPAAAAAAA